MAAPRKPRTPAKPHEPGESTGFGGPRRPMPDAILVELHRRMEARALITMGRQSLSFAAFAKAAGFGAAHLRRILRGPRADVPTSPSLVVLARLASACGLDTWQLLAPLSKPEEREARESAAKLGVDFE